MANGGPRPSMTSPPTQSLTRACLEVGSADGQPPGPLWVYGRGLLRPHPLQSLEAHGVQGPGGARGKFPGGPQTHSTPIGWPRRHANKATSLPEAAERHLLFLARGRRDGRGAGVPPRRRRTRRCCDGGGTRRSRRPAVGTASPARAAPGPPRGPPAVRSRVRPDVPAAVRGAVPTVARRAVAPSVSSEPRTF